MPGMHEIEYKIFGDDMQFVEIELDPNEATVAEAGGMMYMEDGVEMETIFGDGSQQQGGGFLGALMGAGKRAADRRVAVHDRVSQSFGPEEEGRLRRAVSRQDRRRPPRRDRRRADRAEGLVPGCGERRVARHRLSEASSASASSAARDSSCSACRATAGRSCTPAARCTSARSAPNEVIRVDTGCIVGLPTVGQLRHSVRRQDQVGAVRRRGVVLRDAAWPWPRLAAVAAAEPPGRPGHRGRARTREGWTRGRLDPRRPREACSTATTARCQRRRLTQSTVLERAERGGQSCRLAAPADGRVEKRRLRPDVLRPRSSASCALARLRLAVLLSDACHASR